MSDIHDDREWYIRITSLTGILTNAVNIIFGNFVEQFSQKGIVFRIFLANNHSFSDIVYIPCRRSEFSI
jgi:hypothetical protein